MIAMLFSAGLGTRLSPLTDTQPKALVKVLGKPLLQHNIERLIDAGISHIVINIHHFSQQIRDFLDANNNFGIDIILSDESERLLDTGGGLKKASTILKEHNTILLHNVDILSNIDYRNLIEYHNHTKAIATLAVRERDTSRYLLINEKDQLNGWENTKSNDIIYVNTPDTELKRVGFSGIHIISKQLLEYLPDSNQFNIIQWYLKVAQSQPISTYNHNSSYWFDIGTLSKLKEAENHLIQQSPNYNAR